MEQINSLDTGKAREVLERLGPRALKVARKILTRLGPLGLASLGVDTLKTASQLATDHQTRLTEKEERKVLQTVVEELPRLVKKVERNSFARIPDAFNSGAAYTSNFSSAALMGIAWQLKRGVDALNRIGASLDGIKNELEIQTVSQVQGWGQDGFGAHVYRFVRNEMEACARDGGQHRFYVLTPGNTSWHTAFAEKQRIRPLGPNFGGYHHDLGTVCARMWLDRHTMIEETGNSSDTTFHLLIPSFEVVTIEDSIIFHEGLYPLVVKGELYRGKEMVWLNPVLRGGVDLKHIGRLPDPNDQVRETAGKGVMTGAAGFMLFWAAGVATVAFPPLAAYEAYIAAGAVTSWCTAFGSGVVGMGVTTYNDLTKGTPRILGPPLFFNLQNE